ncbi:MAG: cytochrome c [Rhodobiaceae bacterium]|nr:cytochrome c [Rhodobiaceae bacterium]
MSRHQTQPVPGRRAFLGLLVLAAGVAVAVLAATSLFGDNDGMAVDVDAGKALAQANCAGCHAIGQSGDSANPAAPPFRTLKTKWPVENLEEALAEGIVVGHETVEMPEFEFDPEQIGDFIAYLKTL